MHENARPDKGRAPTSSECNQNPTFLLVKCSAIYLLVWGPLHEDFSLSRPEKYFCEESIGLLWILRVLYLPILQRKSTGPPMRLNLIYDFGTFPGTS